MEQLMLDMSQYGPWIITHKGDQTCRALADRHYTRQTVGHRQFCRPGHNLVLRTAQGDALWVVWSGLRDDSLDAYEVTIYRNESNHLSSDLIKWGLYATYQEWGNPPKDGIITYVNETKVSSIHGGYCFLKGGFKKIGRSKRGLLLLQAKHRFITQWNVIELEQIKKLQQLKDRMQEHVRQNQYYDAYRLSRDILRCERTIKRVHQHLKKHGYVSKTDFVPSVSDEQLLAAGIPL